MHPFDLKPKTYIDFNKENKKKDPGLEVGDQKRISKYIFAKGNTLSLFEEVFMIKYVKSTVSWKDFISDLNNEEIVGAFCKKEL